MSRNRYMAGTAVLGARTKQTEAVIGDFNWAQLAQAFGIYTGQSLNPMDILYTGGPAAGRGVPGGASNQYWSRQRANAKQTPWASAGVNRQQAALQLQQVLRQQQAANLASLQAQLAQMSPGAASALSASSAAPAPSYTPDPSFYDTSSAPPSDGSDQTVVGDDSEPAVVIKVKNMADVISNQSALGRLALSATPDLVKNIAYGQMRDQLKKDMADRGVLADVTLSSAPGGKSPTSGIVVGALLGAGAVGIGALLWKFIRGGR